jgi:SAM-dependent methyltransferase
MSDMRERWDLRARRDPVAYIETHRPVADLDGFFALGEQFAQALVDPVLQATGIDRGRALDHGCGLGRMTRALGKRFTAVVGVDVSGEMVRQAEQHHSSDKYPQLTFCETDGIRIPLASESCDFVFSYEVFQHLPSRQVMGENLAEIGRVLRRDGLALIHVHRAPSPVAYWLEKSKRLVPDPLWAPLKLLLGRGDPLTSDATFRGTAPLTRREIARLWTSAGLAVSELRDDPTHEPGDRALVVARPAG